LWPSAAAGLVNTAAHPFGRLEAALIVAWDLATHFEASAAVDAVEAPFEA